MNRADHYRKAEKLLRRANEAPDHDAATHLLLEGIAHALLANASAQVSIASRDDDQDVPG